MGSPYNICRVGLYGDWVPELPDDGEGFQDLKAWSEDDQHLALIQWRIGRSGDPGFVIHVISLATRQVSTSGRRSGCCTELHWSDGSFHYKAFARVRGHIKPPGEDGFQ